jgi:hypothetical protein
LPSADRPAIEMAFGDGCVEHRSRH